MPGLQGYSPADLARLKSAQHIRGGRTNATRDVVTGGRDAKGRPVKRTLDQLGNVVTERWTGQDVEIFLPHLRVQWRPIATEER